MLGEFQSDGQQAPTDYRLRLELKLSLHPHLPVGLPVGDDGGG